MSISFRLWWLRGDWSFHHHAIFGFKSHVKETVIDDMNKAVLWERRPQVKLAFEYLFEIIILKLARQWLSKPMWTRLFQYGRTLRTFSCKNNKRVLVEWECLLRFTVVHTALHALPFLQQCLLQHHLLNAWVQATRLLSPWTQLRLRYALLLASQLLILHASKPPKRGCCGERPDEE